MNKNENKLASGLEVDLAKCAKIASNRCRDLRKRNVTVKSNSIDKILASIRGFRQQGWRYVSELKFGCEHEYEFECDMSTKPMAPVESAIKWMFELMCLDGDLLSKNVSTWRPNLSPGDRVNHAALESLKSHLLKQRPDSNTSFFRIDRTKDASEIPFFKNRVFLWLLACLRASHPVLFLCPIFLDKRKISIYESDPPLTLPRQKRYLVTSYVPAVAFETRTTTFSSIDSIDSYQHGVRCQLFLENNESCFQTLPDYYFNGWIRDCWLITDPSWMGCINCNRNETK